MREAVGIADKAPLSTPGVDSDQRRFPAGLTPGETAIPADGDGPIRPNVATDVGHDGPIVQFHELWFAHRPALVLAAQLPRLSMIIAVEVVGGEIAVNRAGQVDRQVPVITWNEQPADMWPSFELDTDTGPGCVMAPRGLLYAGSDFSWLLPCHSVVGTVGDKDVVVVTAERQPNGACGLVDDRTRIANGNLLTATFFIDETQRAPGFAKIGAAFEHDINVAVILSVDLPPFTECQDGSLLRDDQRRDTKRVIPFGPTNVQMGLL